MSERVQVMVACNHWQNGAFKGCADAVCIEGGDDIAIEVQVLAEAGRPCRLLKGNVLKLDGGKFPYLAHCEWVGNWCWDAFLMAPEVAAGLLNHLRQGDWQIDSGWEGWYDRWESGKPFTAELVREVMG